MFEKLTVKLSALRTRVEKCTEYDGGAFEYLL